MRKLKYRLMTLMTLIEHYKSFDCFECFGRMRRLLPISLFEAGDDVAPPYKVQ